MTDEQIIKALEYCIEQGITSECKKCKLKKGCRTEMIDTALDLINRQKAEIERLISAVDNSTKEFLKLHDAYQDQKAEVERLTEILNSYALQYGTVVSQSKKIKEIKSEAITEYHEEVKKRCIEGGIFPAFVNRQMEDVRKEMVGK